MISKQKRTKHFVPIEYSNEFQILLNILEKKILKKLLSTLILSNVCIRLQHIYFVIVVEIDKLFTSILYFCRLNLQQIDLIV